MRKTAQDDVIVPMVNMPLDDLTPLLDAIYNLELVIWFVFQIYIVLAFHLGIFWNKKCMKFLEHHSQRLHCCAKKFVEHQKPSPQWLWSLGNFYSVSISSSGNHRLFIGFTNISQFFAA